MARGDAQRRRKRMFNRANESNLLKASYGKALPFAKLPDAPIKETDKLPASLRRMAQLQVSFAVLPSHSSQCVSTRLSCCDLKRVHYCILLRAGRC